MIILSAGKNDHDQLGNRGSSGNSLPVPNPRKEKSQYYEFEDQISCLSAGRCHNVVVLKDGSCYGWGCNMLYEIGLPKQQDYSEPSLISFRSFISKYFLKDPFIVKALCGHSFTLYLDKLGVVYIAQGNTDQCSLEKINFSKEEIISLHGYIHPFIVGKSGALYTILDDLTVQPIPFKLSDKSDCNDDDPDSNFIIDACSTKKVIICLTKKGRVYMQNKDNNDSVFTLNKSLIGEKIVKISGKTNYFFVLSEAGRVFMYDSETESELFTPIEFPDDTKIIDISAGYDFNCFIDSNKSLWCSGTKSISPLIGIKRGSSGTPERSSLFDNTKYKAEQVHCGYSHLLILANLANNSPIAESASPQRKSKELLQTETKKTPSKSIFRFPFLSSSPTPEKSKFQNDDDNNGIDTSDTNTSEINIQNYEILNKIKDLTDENENLKKELEKMKAEKLESKKEKYVAELQNENKQLKLEIENLQNLLSKSSNKDADINVNGKKNDNDDDCFGYKISDENNNYYSDKYLLKPTEAIKIFDRRQFLQDFHIIKIATSYNDYGGVSKSFKISLNNFYAVKVLNFTPENLRDSHVMMKMLKHFLREYEIMVYNNHPCILKTFGFNFGDRTHPPSMLLEYCPKNLKSAVEKLKKGRMVRFIVEIAYGMRYLHSNHFIHKNLSPENVLIDKNWDSKITGFGYSKFISDENESDLIITGDKLTPINPFLAPELIETPKDYTNKVDVYSYGILVLYILSHGEYPSDKSEEENEIVHINDKIKIEIPESINQNGKSLIKSCCKCDPNHRPSFDQILQFLKDCDYKVVSYFDYDKLKKAITNIELCEQS